MLFPWIKRPDLISVPHDSGGWVVKDPLRLQYTWLDETEYAILNFLDGHVTLQKLLLRLHELSPQDALTADDLGPFVRSLAGHQLIRQIGPGDSLRLAGPAARPTWQRLLQPLLQLLRIQVPLLNPSRWLTAALPLVSRLTQPFVLKLATVMVFAACLLAMFHLRELQTALPTVQEFLGPQNVLLMLLIFVTVKVLHEAGHALTARYFGAECNECGVMLMVFTPVLYTNVTDTWMLPRRQRLLVTAAGIAVELIVASACMLLWWQASPGLLKSLLLNTMLMCSVNTLLFNGNPLLRFDGYFLLADLVRIPNLAGRSAAVVQNGAQRMVTGRSEQSHEFGHTYATLLIYGLLSMVYRVFLTLAILQLVRHVTYEWHLQLVGAVLTLTIGLGFVVLPAYNFLNQLFARDIMANYDMKAWSRIALAAIIGLAAIFIPLPRSVVSPAFVQSTAAALYTTLAGRLTPEVQYGDDVTPGMVLATLSNPELQNMGQRLTGRVVELTSQRDALISNTTTANSALLPTVRESLKAATQALRKFEEETKSLAVVSTAAGTFLPPPAVPRQERSDLTEFWNGTAVTNRNTGAWMTRGTLLGYVGNRSEVEVMACVSEDDVEFLQPGQSVQFLPVSGGAAPTAGRVKDVATLRSTTLPTNLAISRLVNGRPTADGIEPIEVTYLVTVALTELSDQVPPALYSVGHVRIQTRSTSLFRRVQRYLRQTF